MKFIETLTVIFVSTSIVTTIYAYNIPNPKAGSQVRITGSHNQARSIIASHERSKPIYDGSLMGALFLNAHNMFRKVKNVAPLEWDQNLASYSRKWAEQRANDCRLIHSPNSPYGENLFWGEKGHWTPTDIVKIWVDEGAYYNPQTNECINNTVCGHYTQVVWGTTERVGCGRAVCNNNKGFIYVCSYDPPGNYYYEGPFGGKFSKSIVYPSSAQSTKSASSQSNHFSSAQATISSSTQSQATASASTQSNKSASAHSTTSASTQSNKSASAHSTTSASTQSNKSASTQSTASASTRSNKSASTQSTTSSSTQSNTSASRQPTKN